MLLLLALAERVQGPAGPRVEPWYRAVPPAGSPGPRAPRALDPGLGAPSHRVDSAAGNRSTELRRGQSDSSANGPDGRVPTEWNVLELR